ncbi:STM3941 family protein [Paenibacillus sp. CAU 1782]
MNQHKNSNKGQNDGQKQMMGYAEYPDKKRLALMTLGSLAFVAVGLWMIISGNWVEAIFGVASVLLFGAALLFFLSRLLGRKPSLFINEEGIIDDSSYVSAGTIAWDEIEDIGMTEYSGQRWISIKLRDPQAFLQKQPGFKRWLMNLNNALVDAPIHISQEMLSVPLGRFYEMVLEKWKRSAGAGSQR